MDAFKIRKGGSPIEIIGLGLVDATHEIPLDRAAGVMSELQNDEREPLTGKELVEAAREWADRVGLQVGKAKGEPEEGTTVVNTDPDAAASKED